MTDKTIAIYCFLDDLFKVMGRKTDGHCKVSDAEVATTALIAALYFHGHQTTAGKNMRAHHGMKMIDKSTFNRRLHRLESSLVVIFHALGSSLKELNTSTRYVIDSFPVAVCRNCWATGKLKASNELNEYVLEAKSISAVPPDRRYSFWTLLKKSILPSIFTFPLASSRINWLPIRMSLKLRRRRG